MTVIRLIDTDNPANLAPSKGRVEIKIWLGDTQGESDWGGICDDSFGRNDAIVACRQLGYP